MPCDVMSFPPDEVWRAELAVGDELDCFDGKQWRESCVVSIDVKPEDVPVVRAKAEPAEAKDDAGEEGEADADAAKASADAAEAVAEEAVPIEIPEGAILVRFRNAGSKHRILTSRSAGAKQEKGAKPSEGDIAKPYAHVSDWRTQLRRDMKVEVITGHETVYICEETETSLHFVGNHTRFNEWWVSDHIGAKQHNRRGYLNVRGENQNLPPTTDQKKWIFQRGFMKVGRI